MGSAATGAVRRDRLARLGVSAIALDRLTSPIGIIPAARSPELLAVSVLTEIMARFDQRFLTDPRPHDG
jgi:xanthine dehydrogenase accessory factor